MLRCPHCNAISASIRITGPVLIAVGTIELDEDGDIITAISPMNAVQTIKAGDELKAEGFTFTCLACSHSAPKEQFESVRTCVFSGEAANTQVLTPFGTVYVREEYVADALRVFSVENGRTEAPLTPEELV